MSFPVREIGVIGALTLLSITAADGIAYIAQKADRHAAKKNDPPCRETMMAEILLRNTQQLSEFWDESLRSRASLHASSSWDGSRRLILNPDEAL